MPLPSCTANFSDWARARCRKCASRFTAHYFVARRFVFSADRQQTNLDKKTNQKAWKPKLPKFATKRTESGALSRKPRGRSANCRTAARPKNQTACSNSKSRPPCEIAGVSQLARGGGLD